MLHIILESEVSRVCSRSGPTSPTTSIGPAREVLYEKLVDAYRDDRRRHPLRRRPLRDDDAEVTVGGSKDTLCEVYVRLRVARDRGGCRVVASCSRARNGQRAPTPRAVNAAARAIPAPGPSGTSPPARSTHGSRFCTRTAQIAVTLLRWRRTHTTSRRCLRMTWDATPAPRTVRYAPHAPS